MSDARGKGIYTKITDVFSRIAAMRIPMYAAYATFFLVLSVFPALVSLLSLLRFAGLDVRNLTELLPGVLPEALIPAAKRLILSTYYNSTGTLVSLSALTALWSAGRGIHGLTIGLNAIYRVQESRSYLRTRSVSVLYTVAFLLVLVLTLVLHVFGESLLSWFPIRENALLSLLAEILSMRFFLLLFTQTTLFTAMFCVLPNRKNHIGESLPGALLASIGWLVFSDLFSLYVEHFVRYTDIFGSVYAVALGMLWLYSCVSIVFYGGALNAYLAQREP